MKSNLRLSRFSVYMLFSFTVVRLLDSPDNWEGAS